MSKSTMGRLRMCAPARCQRPTMIVAAFFLGAGLSVAHAQQDPCDDNACCVNPATCVVTDKQTLAALTIDSIVPCDFTLGTYCTGGNGTTGIAPCPIGDCGLSFCFTWEPPATALNSLDHHWLQSTGIPKVVDFGTPVNTAIVFVAVDHGPFPEEGIESTVWGSNECNITDFPAGWTLATLTTIWKRGWEDPVGCQGQDNADDFTGQYSFPGAGFRYVAVHANFSISIFDDPSHTSWSNSNDNSVVPGWQSFDDEIDAIGTPQCDPGTVVADAGPDQSGTVGEQICFDGSGSTAENGILVIGWDLDGDNEIDVIGDVACITCEEASEGEVTLFVTDNCGCVDSDTALFTCTSCEPVEDPDVRTQGFWKRVCAGPHPSGEHENLPGYVDCVSNTETFADVDDVDALCDRLHPSPPNDKCEQAEAQFMALLLNICSGRVAVCNCIDDPDFDTVGEAADFIDELLSNPGRTFDDCELAQAIADDINNGVSLVSCPELPPCEGEPLSCSDLNGDGVVDACDLILLLAAWGPCNGSCPADCDGSGAVGTSDLLVLLGSWTGGAPAGIWACIAQFNPDGELEALIACVEPFCNCQ